MSERSDTPDDSFRLAEIISSIAAVGFLTYTLGWVYTLYYLRMFGASWLMVQFEPKDLLNASSMPLTVLVVGFLLFAVCDRLILLWFRLSLPTRLVAGLLALTLICVGVVWTSGLDLVDGAIKTLALLAGSLVYAIFTVAYSRPHREHSHFILYVLTVLLLLFVAAASVGIGAAIRDLDPSSSHLSKVITKEKTDRLLFLLHGTNDRIFVVELPSRGPAPQIEALGWDSVKGLVASRSPTKRLFIDLRR